MKTMKVALLATAALAAASVSARADDEAAALKAQIEALNARVAQLEAAPAVPTGYSLLTASRVQNFALTGEKKQDVWANKAHRISVLPTADMPAATTIDWDLEVRAAVGLARFHGVDWKRGHGWIKRTTGGVAARGRIRVKATTETSVGTVGVDLRLQGGGGVRDHIFSRDSLPNGNGYSDRMNIAWGWWQMTPEWTLGGGYTGTLADPGHGQDGWVTFGDTIYFGTEDTPQMRLTYSSGPLTWAIAVESSDHWDYHSRYAYGIASRVDYAGDLIAGSVSGYYAPARSHHKDNWQVAAGADITAIDMFDLSVAGGLGRHNDHKWWGLSGFAGFDLTDEISAEASYGYRKWKHEPSLQIVNAGVYWQPVDQLKIGFNGYHKVARHKWMNETVVSFVTWFSY